MKNRFFLVAALLLISLGAFAQRQQVFNPTKPYVHDPVMAKQGDTYYVFGTGNGISCMSSKDLKTWKEEKPVFAKAPDWIMEAMPDFRNHIWAPDIIWHQGQWHLFYACSRGGLNTSWIGHCTTPTLDPSSPDFKWTDHGCVLQSVPSRDMWNAIDPNIVFDEEGHPWLNFGSFWNGIMIVKMEDDLSAIAKPEVWRNLCRRQRTFELDAAEAGDGQVEAPFIFKKNGWYYLFVSFDYCCRGVNSTYKVAIGRSKTVTGPYLDKEGKNLANGGGSILLTGDGVNYVAVGHNSAYTMDGKDYFVTHAYQVGNGESKLVISEIKWEDEWPVLSF